MLKSKNFRNLRGWWVRHFMSTILYSGEMILKKEWHRVKEQDTIS